MKRTAARPMKLTQRSVAALTPEPNGDFIAWDTETRGLGVRVWPTGRKLFVLRYRAQGSRRLRYLTLGEYGQALTVAAARTEAVKRRGDIAKGDDPAETRRAARQAPTVRELGTLYLDDADARRKPATAGKYRLMWTRYVLPRLGAMEVSRVRTTDVARLHRALSKRPTTGNRVLALISSFYGYATRHGAATTNPARGVPRYRETGRERFLTAAEFQAIGAALRTAETTGLPSPPERRRGDPSKPRPKHRPKVADTPQPADPVAVNALRLLMLSGCRLSEVLTLRWDSVDLERGFLRFGDTKTGKSVRPLGAPAAALLASLDRDTGSPWVFPGKGKGEHLTTVRRLWDQIRHATGLTDLRAHDLRHSFASISALGGDSLLVIRSLLGHRTTKMAERYAHLGADPVKRAADRTAEAIAALLAGQGTAPTPLSTPRSSRSA